MRPACRPKHDTCTNNGNGSNNCRIPTVHAMHGTVFVCVIQSDWGRELLCHHQEVVSFLCPCISKRLLGMVIVAPMEIMLGRWSRHDFEGEMSSSPILTPSSIHSSSIPCTGALHTSSLFPCHPRPWPHLWPIQCVFPAMSTGTHSTAKLAPGAGRHGSLNNISRTLAPDISLIMWSHADAECSVAIRHTLEAGRSHKESAQSLVAMHLKGL